MAKGTLFLGGVPTEPDVRKLLTAVELNPGQTATYAQLAEALRLDPRSSRFITVVHAWRKWLLAKENVDTAAVRGVGIRRLPEFERVVESADDFRKGARKIARAYGRASAVQTEQLSEAEQHTAMHARRVMEATLNAARTATKEVSALFAPTRTLPRLVPASRREGA